MVIHWCLDTDWCIDRTLIVSTCVKLTNNSSFLTNHHRGASKSARNVYISTPLARETFVSFLRLWYYLSLPLQHNLLFSLSLYLLQLGVFPCKDAREAATAASSRAQRCCSGSVSDGSLYAKRESRTCYIYIYPYTTRLCYRSDYVLSRDVCDAHHAQLECLIDTSDNPGL